MGDIVSIELFNSISSIINEARNRIKTTVNSAMVLSYWNIGRLIVEDEQQGKPRAKYGKMVLKELSIKLTDVFGKGFSERNLRYFRTFYLLFPKRNAVRSEMSWTHYRYLLKVEKEDARLWYQNEAIWSSPTFVDI